jgi:hypothetical protein
MKGKLRISTMAVVFLTGVGATAFAAGSGGGGGGGGAGAGAIGGGAAASPTVPTRPAPGPGLPGINPALTNRPCAGGVPGAPANQNSPLPNSVHRLNEEDQRLLREVQRADDKLAEVGNPKSASSAQSGNAAVGSSSVSGTNRSSTTLQNLDIPQTNGTSPEGPRSNPNSGARTPGGC